MPSPQAIEFAMDLLSAYPGRQMHPRNRDSLADALESVGLSIASDIVALLKLRSADPPSVAQVYQTAREVRAETMSPAPIFSACVFAYGKRCPSCEVVHGPLMRDDDVAHGIRHVKVFLATGERAELDRAREPSRCECGMTEGAMS